MRVRGWFAACASSSIACISFRGKLFVRSSFFAAFLLPLRSK
jgi:hypothetical protein